MEKSEGFKVLMLPWLAHGHISPYIQLARKLVLSNPSSHIYLCSTKVNLDFMRESFENEANVELVELHLADDRGLPPHYLTTKGLPPHMILDLIQAFQSESHNFSTILRTVAPDLLIFDGFQSWAPTLAAERNIPSVFFTPLSAVCLAYMYHSTVSSGTPFPCPSIFMRDHEIAAVAQSPTTTNAIVSPMVGFELSSEMVLLKTCKEIEAKYAGHLSFLSGKEMVTTGPLAQRPNADAIQEELKIINFLDGKAESSVVFVNFGSECYLSEEEMEEIALGLELSNVEFIWVIRFPSGQKVAIEDAVPEGYLSRVRNRGIVVDGWAPQAEILRHKSVGGFLSHCGWGSTLESLCSGVPIIAMPMLYEQPLNARLVVEIGAGLEALRDENGRMERGQIASAIKAVMVDKSGEDIRAKARVLSETLSDGAEEKDAMERIWKLCDKYKQCRASNV